MMKRKLIVRRRYIAEFNRCVGDSIWRVVRRLQRRGYEVERVPQLTTLSIRRPVGVTMSEFRADLRSLLQPRRGSLILCSSSGRAWSCNMRGNRPGDFVKI
jgi:hypothetical protein